MKFCSKSNTVGLRYFQLVAMTTLEIPSRCKPCGCSLIGNQKSMWFCKIWHFESAAHQIVFSLVFENFHSLNSFDFACYTSVTKLDADHTYTILEINRLTTQTGKMTQNLNIAFTYARLITIVIIQLPCNATEPNICPQLGLYLEVLLHINC